MKKNGGGDCYYKAGHMIVTPEFKSFTLVHALVNGQGEMTGYRFGHAWLEHEGTVVDYSNGNSVICPKEFYYGLGNVKESELKRYNKEEAVEKMLEYGHYGPWDITGKIIKL